MNINLTDLEVAQLIHSLENDWVDNDSNSKRIINRILSKIHLGNKQ